MEHLNFVGTAVRKWTEVRTINKFKKWLIKKLGGEIKPPETQNTRETVSAETIKIRIEIPYFKNLSFHPSTEKIINQMRVEISNQVGEFLFDNGLLRFQREFDRYSHCEYIEVIAKVIREWGCE